MRSVMRQLKPLMQKKSSGDVRAAGLLHEPPSTQPDVEAVGPHDDRAVRARVVAPEVRVIADERAGPQPQGDALFRRRVLAITA